MDWKTTATLTVTLIVAVTGYVVKYLNDISVARRKDRLDRINRQLNELYGPLFALTSTSNTIFYEFRKIYRPGKKFWISGDPPTAAEAAAWRLWISEVFMPINIAIERVIVEHADLLNESQMPPCLLTLCAHVSAYKVVLKRWEGGDYSENKSLMDFPGNELAVYTEESYTALKAEQERLLGELRPPTRKAHLLMPWR